MTKTKKKTKVSVLSLFRKPQLMIAMVFVLGFGGFGVYKLAFSSAATPKFVKIVGCNVFGNIGEASGPKAYVTADTIEGIIRGADITISRTGNFSFKLNNTEKNSTLYVRWNPDGGSNMYSIGVVKNIVNCP